MNIEAKLTRPELWSWLEQREDPFLEAKHGEGSSFIVKIPKDAEIDYLFGNDSYYGDSINDRYILEACGFPYTVNPSASLRVLAERQHWPILSWKLEAVK